MEKKDLYIKQYKSVIKRQLFSAFLLYLDDTLKNKKCEKVQNEGNYNCKRCDICMMNQYIERIKNGELPKLLQG